MRPGGARLEDGFPLNGKSVFIREIRVCGWSFATKTGIA
jgi:hypothetical protein